MNNTREEREQQREDAKAFLTIGGIIATIIFLIVLPPLGFVVMAWWGIDLALKD